MKAVICTKYGAPEVLVLMDKKKPDPKDNEVLIRIHSATAGPADCAFRKGDPFIVRIIYGLRKPKSKFECQGVEFAGEIEAVGKQVKQFKSGDRVFGLSVDSFGAYAEYKCLPEDKLMAFIPSQTAYEDIVSVCDGAPTALVFLRDKARIQPGQKVLINGASGSVGAFGVQLATYFGAEVTGVCSTANMTMVKALGAEHVIDYTKADFTLNGQSYDVIFDAVGKSSFSRCKGSLTPKGVYLTTVPTLRIIFDMMGTSKSKGKKAIFAAAGLEQTKENLRFLKELCETGNIRPVIDRSYPLEQISEAHRYVELGHKKGTVVISV